MEIWIRTFCILPAILTFCMLCTVAAVYHPGQLILRTCEEFARSVRTQKKGILDYEKVAGFLEHNGAAYHFGAWVEPIRYTAVRVILSAAGLLIGTGYGILNGILCAMIIFWIPGFLLIYLNGRDNERMLPELKLMYQALAMQIRAGVYVTDALAEMYGSVREERLRNALLDLSGDIVMKSDLDEALTRFQGRFDNRYVDSLCITVQQAMESGQAVELLSDISEQIKDMEVTVLEKKKSALDRRITFYQLGILAAVLTVVLYACVTHMFTAAVSF